MAAKEEASIAKAFARVDAADDGLRGTRWAGVPGDPSMELPVTELDRA